MNLEEAKKILLKEIIALAKTKPTAFLDELNKDVEPTLLIPLLTPLEETLWIEDIAEFVDKAAEEGREDESGTDESRLLTPEEITALLGKLAECQQQAERILKEIEGHMGYVDDWNVIPSAQRQRWILEDVWQDIKKRKGVK